jgi:hypothetical protein
VRTYVKDICTCVNLNLASLIYSFFFESFSMIFYFLRFSNIFEINFVKNNYGFLKLIFFFFLK